ncbi:MAG: hypothetical protein ACREBU_03150, partial [Nitrososphaera sp.]
MVKATVIAVPHKDFLWFECEYHFTNAYHIVALAPFVIAGLIMYPDILYAIQYYQALENCQFPTCPDVVPDYGGIFGGLIVSSIGIVILV